MLLPAFLPFNLLKGGLNTALTMLLYKPVVTALRRAGLVPPSSSSGENSAAPSKKISIGMMIVSLVILVTCILLVLVMRGII